MADTDATTKNAASPKFNIINPQTDEDFFTIGRIIAKRYSTCLKTNTAALIVDRNHTILSWGVNMCCPQGQLYGLPVTECPRMDTQTGTSYALCMPLHAEIVACLNAFGIGTADRKNLWHFPGFTKRLREYAGFFKSRGSVLYLIGHYWACDECIDFLRSAGIDEIKFDDLSGGSTLKSYRAQGLAQVDENALNASGTILAGIVTVEIAKKDVGAFCRKHDIDPAEIHPFLDIDSIFTVSVPEGKERESVSQFRNDPYVKNAHTISLN